MSYLAFWGLLFCFGLLLFRGKHWWRMKEKESLLRLSLSEIEYNLKRNMIA